MSSIATSDNNSDGVIDNGDQVAVSFSEAVTLANAASFTFRDADGSVGTLSNGGNATMSLNSAGTTAFINVTGAPVPEELGARWVLTAPRGTRRLPTRLESRTRPVTTSPRSRSLLVVRAHLRVDRGLHGQRSGGRHDRYDGRLQHRQHHGDDDSVSVSGDTITVTLTGTPASGDTVTLKANSINNTDGGNGPASAVTATKEGLASPEVRLTVLGTSSGV